ncbi:cobalt ECF transporter T component CbiQ [Methanosphaera sp. WGK6]|uniref:cobalt ECF transporter T component CbiQ n=1 Tax=Methanosphaera sp. WGK6 TaxID=1561964 RepID=UPI000A068A38|nr:cobalt ECF transporter T component CbiQ [Methanosphaera sp. WGK6]
MSIFEDTLDHYTAHNNLSENNIYYKTLFAVLTLIINLFANSPIVPFLIFIICTIIIIGKAKIPAKFYATFMAVPFGFALISVIFMAFFFGVGDHIWNLGIFGWGITADGLNRGVLVFFKVMGGVSALAVLILTTPMNRVFGIFHDLHVPSILTDLAILMYRYIFLFLDVTATMYNSQKTRLGYHSYMSWMHCLASLAGMVFIRTWEQGEISYKALASRGYNGRLNMIRQGDNIKDISAIEWICLIVFEVLVAYGIYITGTINVVPVLI